MNKQITSAEIKQIRRDGAAEYDDTSDTKSPAHNILQIQKLVSVVTVAA